MIGGGKVRNSSVWTHVARGALGIVSQVLDGIGNSIEKPHHRQRSQNSMVIRGKRDCGGLMSSTVGCAEEKEVAG